MRTVPTIPRYATRRYTRRQREHQGARGAFDTEISRLGFEPRSDLVHAGPVDPPGDVIEALHLDPSGQTLISKRHMYAGGTPVQLATSYVPWTLAEGAQLHQADTGPGGTYPRLAELRPRSRPLH